MKMLWREYCFRIWRCECCIGRGRGESASRASVLDRCQRRPRDRCDSESHARETTTEMSRAIQAEVLTFEPQTPVVLDWSLFLRSSQTSRRGSFPTPGSCTCEHVKVLDTATFELFF